MRMKNDPDGAHPDDPDGVQMPQEEVSGLIALLEKQLAEAGRLNTIDGQKAIIAARQLGAKMVSPNGWASLSKEFDRIFERAMVGVQVKAGDDVDEIAKRRDAKRRRVG